MPPHSKVDCTLNLMLECQLLRLTPWQWVTPAHAPQLPAPSSVRLFYGGDPETLLGFARVARGPAWFGCGPRRIDVCETEDASLLMSLEHGWFGFGRWHVNDAEHARVGGVVGRHLLDEQGFRFATIWQEGPAFQVTRSRGGAPLARCETALDGAVVLRFSDDLEANPFLRMVLLGAAVLSKH